MNSAPFPFGYCTNVHAGVSTEQAKSNLLKYAQRVRELVVPDGALPLGLWLSDRVATDLIENDNIQGFAEWLGEHQFVPYTLNGFPQGDFHQAVVKHAVYHPTWADAARKEHTFNLIDVLHAILPADELGSISTLPLGWPHETWTDEKLRAAAGNLIEVALRLDQLLNQTGREIVLAIEPEPGCVLNTAPEIADFFERFLWSSPHVAAVQRHLTVCHDICHSGVMFEPQEQALELYRSKGIRIGKVQVSSAVHVPWDKCSGSSEYRAILEQLETFDEPKYLHQTSRCHPDGTLEFLQEDLNLALSEWNPEQSPPTEPWRIHFHVPIFVNTFDHLETTQADILTATAYLEKHGDTPVNGAPWFTGHYEVETYAWPVLPASIGEQDLSAGIARELQYFQGVLC